MKQKQEIKHLLLLLQPHHPLNSQRQFFLQLIKKIKSMTKAVATPSQMPIIRCMGNINSNIRPNGRAEIPDSVVSSVTATAPNVNAVTEASTDAVITLLKGLSARNRGLKTSGYATRHENAAMFIALQPKASSPPSAKSRHCSTMTEVRVKNPPHAPSIELSKMPPMM